MKLTFIKQDRFVIKDKDGKMIMRGNCLQATLASLLGLQLRDVPDFSLFFDNTFIDWNDLKDRWLNSLGYEMVNSPEYKQIHNIPFNAADESWFGDFNPPAWNYITPYEVCGKSPRGDFYHSAIYVNGELLHDPHPSNDGCEPHSETWPWTISTLITII